MARSPMARIASLVALLAFVGYANAARTPVGASRSLLQLNACDVDCADASTSCRSAGTEGKFICTSCRVLSDGTPTYLVAAVDGSCGCAAGQYLVPVPNSNGLQKCEDCPLNFYCPGGTKLKSQKLPCHYKEGTADAATTEGLITRRTKSRSRSSCVNKPGYSYTKSASGVPTAVKCDGNTYSTGLLKQATCTPCPAGAKVDSGNIGGKTQDGSLRDSIEVCKAPPGWFISNGYKVVKCPKGEYKGGYNTDKKCTKCPEGLTTKATGSSTFSQCDRTLAGYSFVPPSGQGRHLLQQAPEGLKAQLCPQKYYCQGGVQYSAGESGATLCPTGLWTRGLGAKSLDACLVPPGYYFSTVENTVKECSTVPFDGEYQPLWGKPTDTVMQACSKCGDEFKSEATIPLDVYANDDNSLNGMPNSTYVRGTEMSCYIEQGMGVIPKGSGVAAVYCTGNGYGVASTNKRYGRATEGCIPCSIDMVTDATDDILTQWTNWGQTYPRTQRTKSDGTTVKVFYGPEACIVPPGFGYEGDIAIACPKGTYAPGARGASSFDDIDNKCTACPDGRTTTNDKRTQLSDCNLILPGYGYATVANVGMAVPCEAGFYRGPTTISFGNSADAACQACPASRTTSGPRSTQQSDCNLCVAGYGIADANPADDTACTACGTPSDITKAGTYGPVDRQANSYACKECPAGTEFVQSIFYQDQTKSFTPRLVTPNAAQTASQCMLEFAQIDTKNNFLVATTGWMVNNWQQRFAKTDASGAGASVDACVAKCAATDACQMVQYDHSASGSTIACYMRTATGNTNSGASDVLIAAKNQLSTQQTVTSSSLDGVYTFWEDTTGGHYQLQDVGVEQDSTSVNTMAKCLDACTNEGKCAFAAMSFGAEVNGKRPFSKCYLVNGALVFSSPKQQLIRAVPTKLAPNAKYIPA